MYYKNMAIRIDGSIQQGCDALFKLADKIGLKIKLPSLRYIKEGMPFPIGFSSADASKIDAFIEAACNLEDIKVIGVH